MVVRLPTLKFSGSQHCACVAQTHPCGQDGMASARSLVGFCPQTGQRQRSCAKPQAASRAACPRSRPLDLCLQTA
eukprot:1157517-Amphidinium_carterae.1